MGKPARCPVRVGRSAGAEARSETCFPAPVSAAAEPEARGAGEDRAANADDAVVAATPRLPAAPQLATGNTVAR